MSGKNLIDQLRAAGATVHPSVDFFAVNLGHDHGPAHLKHQQAQRAGKARAASRKPWLGERGVVARSRIQRGEVLVSLPPGCYLPPPLQPGTRLLPGTRRLIAAISELEPRPNAFLAAALQLLHISSSESGCDSWLLPYVGSLPKAYPQLPMCWSDAQLAALDGTSVDRSVVDRVERLRLGLGVPVSKVPNISACNPSRQPLPGTSEPDCSYSQAVLDAFDHHVRPLVAAHPQLFPPASCTLSQFRACVCAVSSRSFTTRSIAQELGINGTNTKGDMGEKQDDINAQQEEQGRFMLPLIDMLNHCAAEGAATVLRFEPSPNDVAGADKEPAALSRDVGGRFSLVAERDIPDGGLIEHSYGTALTDAQLALSYGFCVLGASRIRYGQPTSSNGRDSNTGNTYDKKGHEPIEHLPDSLTPTYRCSVDIPLLLLRRAALSLNFMAHEGTTSCGQSPTDSIHELRCLALRRAGLGSVCSQSGRPATTCTDNGEDLSAALLLESNWIGNSIGSDLADDENEDQGEGQEIVGRQTGTGRFVTAALILATDTVEQLHRYIDQCNTVAVGPDTSFGDMDTEDHCTDNQDSEDGDSLLVLAGLCASVPDKRLDAGSSKSCASTTSSSATSDDGHAKSSRLSSDIALDAIVFRSPLDRSRLSKRLCKLLIKTIELRDSLYGRPRTLIEDEATLAALIDHADAMHVALSYDGQAGDHMQTTCITALAVRVGERRLLHAVKDFFVALEEDANGTSDSHSDTCSEEGTTTTGGSSGPTIACPENPTERKRQRTLCNDFR